MKLRTAIVQILLLCLPLTKVNAEKLTQGQFTSNIESYSSILKDVNSKYAIAEKNGNLKDIVFQHCRRLGIYHEMLIMAQENRQLSEATSLEIFMKDTLQENLRPILGIGMTEEEFCIANKKR